MLSSHIFFSSLNKKGFWIWTDKFNSFDIIRHTHNFFCSSTQIIYYRYRVEFTLFLLAQVPWQRISFEPYLASLLIDGFLKDEQFQVQALCLIYEEHCGGILCVANQWLEKNTVVHFDIMTWSRKKKFNK